MPVKAPLRRELLPPLPQRETAPPRRRRLLAATAATAATSRSARGAAGSSSRARAAPASASAIATSSSSSSSATARKKRRRLAPRLGGLGARGRHRRLDGAQARLGARLGLERLALLLGVLLRLYPRAAPVLGQHEAHGAGQQEALRDELGARRERVRVRDGLGRRELVALERQSQPLARRLVGASQRRRQRARAGCVCACDLMEAASGLLSSLKTTAKILMNGSGAMPARAAEATAAVAAAAAEAEAVTAAAETAAAAAAKQSTCLRAQNEDEERVFPHSQSASLISFRLEAARGVGRQRPRRSRL